MDKKNAKILVTGGAGFVGSYVVEAILEHDPASVVVLDDLSRGSEANMVNFIDHPAITFIKGDVCDEQLIDKLMKETDYCFHLAAKRINACAADPKSGFDVMVKAMFRIAEAARVNRIKKVIYSSSVSVYGQAGELPTPETQHPYDDQTLYGAGKLFGEKLLRSYHHTYQLDYVGLRYFNIYGPRMDIYGKYTEVLVKWLDCIRESRSPAIFGEEPTAMDFVYVKDVARANILAWQSECSDEVFNIGTGRMTTLEDLLKLLLEVNQADLQLQYLPENKVNPVKRRQADISKAREMLGFESQVDLREGLRQLSAWYFEQYR